MNSDHRPDLEADAEGGLPIDSNAPTVLSDETLIAETPLASDDDWVLPQQPTVMVETREAQAPQSSALPAYVTTEQAASNSPPEKLEPGEPATEMRRSAQRGSMAPPRKDGIEIGSVLFGEYEILSVLGAGGMGEVYKARHRKLDEYRAIKMMRADLSTTWNASALFLREAKALLAMRHSGVVRCHDLLSDDDGRAYLIMELVDGEALSGILVRNPLSSRDVLILGARLGAGLNAAHRKGIIHRDLSPDNIILPDGDVARAKLIDFGIAKVLTEGGGTIVDGFKGKLGYASPEQLGFFGGEIDGRSDLYSLGLVLCAAAIGRPMGMGTTIMEAVEARKGLVRIPDEIPDDLRTALQPLLALDPKDRPRKAEHLFLSSRQVGSVGDETGDHPSVPTQMLEAVGVRSKSRVPAIAALTIAAMSIAGATAYFASRGEGGASLSEPIAGTARSGKSVDAAPPRLRAKAIVATAKQDPITSAARSGGTKQAAKPVIKKVGALEKFRIAGLLNGANSALGELRLKLPAGDNAFEKYNEVLKIDPGNAAARRGLSDVAERYLDLCERELRAGRLGKARSYLGHASTITPNLQRVASVRRAVEQAASR